MVQVVHQDMIVQRVDNTIQWINLYLVDSPVCFVKTYIIQQIVIYPLDSIICPSYNWAQDMVVPMVDIAIH